MASIDDFVANISTTGLTQANRYELRITPPTIGFLQNPDNFLRFRVPSITLPGKTISTTETKIYGPIRMAPYTTTYDQLTFNIYLSDNLNERDWFENWFHQVIDFTTHKISYYNDYVAPQAEFITYDKEDNPKHSVKFENLYPITIGPVEYAYANEEPAQCQITMFYRKYRSEFSENRAAGRQWFREWSKNRLLGGSGGL